MRAGEISSTRCRVAFISCSRLNFQPSAHADVQQRCSTFKQFAIALSLACGHNVQLLTEADLTTTRVQC
jgi:hypothetical protein